MIVRLLVHVLFVFKLDAFLGLISDGDPHTAWVMQFVTKRSVCLVDYEKQQSQIIIYVLFYLFYLSDNKILLFIVKMLPHP